MIARDKEGGLKIYQLINFGGHDTGGQADGKPAIVVSGQSQPGSSSDLQLPNGSSGVRERKVHALPVTQETSKVAPLIDEKIVFMAQPHIEGQHASKQIVIDLAEAVAQDEQRLLSGPDSKPVYLNPLSPFYLTLRQAGHSDDHLHNLTLGEYRQLVQQYGRSESQIGLDATANHGGVLGESMRKHRDNP